MVTLTIWRVATTTGANGATGPAGARGTTGARGPAGKSAASFTVSCKLTGKRKTSISCKTKQKSNGRVRARLTRNGKLVASGQSRSRNGVASLHLTGKSVRAGRYTLTVTLPTASGTYRTVRRSLILN